MFHSDNQVLWPPQKMKTIGTSPGLDYCYSYLCHETFRVSKLLYDTVKRGWSLSITTMMYYL